MNIEEIIEASNARKRFDLSKRLKQKSPIYVKKDWGIPKLGAAYN